MIDLNQFYAWQAEKPESRTVKIEIKGDSQAEVFVWDRTLIDGYFVKSVEEIDLEGRAQEKEFKRFIELKAKYENGGNIDG